MKQVAVFTLLLLFGTQGLAEICNTQYPANPTHISKNDLLEGTDQKWFFIIPLERDLSFYGTKPARAVARNMILLQMPTGGWRKNIAPNCTLLTEEDRQYLIDSSSDNEYPSSQRYRHNGSTLDNNATHTQIRFLMRVALVTEDSESAAAAIKGLEYILKAQYDFGGWPQNYPNLASYGKNVTFNDNAFAGAMVALKEATSGRFSFISKSLQKRSQQAFDKGLDYILKSQLVVHGRKAGWAQQYLPDESFQPAQGRIYELPSIATEETLFLVKLLLSLEKPSQEVKLAVNSAIAWLAFAKLENTKVSKVYDTKWNQIFKLVYTEDPAGIAREHKFDGSRFGFDKIVTHEPGATPIWAQFYDLRTFKPIFAGWDGTPKPTLAEIDYSRRVDYNWYIPQYRVDDVLDKSFKDVSVKPFDSPPANPDNLQISGGSTQ